jgi:hypothetical protein
MVMYRKYFKKDIDVVIFFAENVAFPIMLLMNNFLNPYRKKINKYYPAFRFCSIIKR